MRAQLLHADHHPLHEVDERSASHRPLSVLLGVQAGSKIELKDCEDGHLTKVECGPGDAVVFSGDQLHRGLGHDTKHYRVFFYVVPKELQLERKLTKKWTQKTLAWKALSTRARALKKLPQELYDHDGTTARRAC